MNSEQFKLEAYSESRQEILEFENSLFYKNENTPIGWLRHLALEKGDWKFTATHKAGDTYVLTHSTDLSFDAELKEQRGQQKGTYAIRGCVRNNKDKKRSFFEGINLHGTSKDGWKLRPAQLGAVHALLAHWSLSAEPATVVLPTGTGKTETMLVTTLIEQALRTLVVVPTKDLKEQIGEKFMSWGMLRKLGVLPSDAPNPNVLILTKTITETAHLDHIVSADVVITTPALVARAPNAIKTKLQELFSHVYFDEAHHVVASEWNDIKGLFSVSKIVQFTATPYRNDRKPIEGKLVYNYPLSRALDDKCFSPISLVAVDERHPRKKDQAIADAAMARLREDRARACYALFPSKE